MAGYLSPGAYFYAEEQEYLQAYEDVLERYKGRAAPRTPPDTRTRTPAGALRVPQQTMTGGRPVCDSSPRDAAMMMVMMMMVFPPSETRMVFYVSVAIYLWSLSFTLRW